MTTPTGQPFQFRLRTLLILTAVVAVACVFAPVLARIAIRVLPERPWLYLQD